MSVENTIEGGPRKEFFIDMITRDITLTDSIFDLIDNSTHSLVVQRKLDVMDVVRGKKKEKVLKGSFIHIKYTDKQFSIEDNCGGISIDDAKNGVFEFGAPEDETGQPGLSVYGIGMKRAIFKMGEEIEIESRTTAEHWRVTIDVELWKDEDKSWNHKFDFANKVRTPVGKAGTRIVVRRLHPGISSNFQSTFFKRELLNRIGSVYSLFLMSGLDVRVNNVEAQPTFPAFAESKDLQTEQKILKIDGIDVLIQAGMTGHEDRQPRGWYVFCNGRLVLEADKSRSTGWGREGFPSFHTKYNHFMGIVYFKSKDPSLLPWRTTKGDVNMESNVYQRALNEMKIVAKPILDSFSRMYEADIPVQSSAEYEVLKNAPSRSALALSRKGRQTQFKIHPKEGSPGDELVSITYRKRKRDVDRVKKALKKPRATNKAVGLATFEYYVIKELGG